MATWEFKVTGLEVLSYDESDWSITQIVNDTVQIEENNIIRLYHKAKDIIKKQFPKYCSIIINSFERIDKKTGKDYGVFEDTTDLLVYNLSSAQRANLKQLKAQILEEVVGPDKLRNDLRLLMSDDGSVKYITDNLACLQSSNRTIIHEEAEEILTAIDRFYSRITPNELAILCMKESALSHEELQLLRSYSFHERQQAKSVRNQKVIFLKSKIHTDDSLQIKEDELRSFLDLSHKTGLNIFSKLLEWAVDNSEELLEKLESLIANYKDALTKEYDRLVNRSSRDFEVFNPPCLVILGNLEEELTSPKQKKSFELFRNGLKDVQIITYDELFKKVEILVNLLEGNNSA